MDLNPAVEMVVIRFNFDFQVWRPSPTVNETGCYSLVDNFIVRSTSLPTSPESEHVARVTPSPQDQLQFQPGDVLGFYVESHGEGSQTGGDDNNGVVLLNNGSYTSEFVWFASIDITAKPSQSGSCPYPVGTNGVLNSSTHAAPVISINLTTYSCPVSVSLITSSSVNTLTAFSPQQIPTISTPTTRNTDGLVAGVVVTVIIVCIAVLIVIITLAIVIIVKRHNVVKKKSTSTTTDSLALANQVYGKL